MTRTYSISVGNAAVTVAFALLWFGLFFVGVVRALIDGRVPAHIAVAFALLAVALLPALAFARQPYRITLRDDEECEFRAVLRRRRIRVQRIRAIEWDDEAIAIVYDSGKIRIDADRGFEGFLIRLLELNPLIKADDGVRALLANPSATAALQGWDSDGHWQGPHDLRVFLRRNWFFAGIWLAIFSGFFLLVFTDVMHSQRIGIPLGLLVGWVAWFGLMFAFAHGWISEGD